MTETVNKVCKKKRVIDSLYGLYNFMNFIN